ncbi:MAG: VCBS repeat-containing protein [Acidobacteriota bacterium]|nr:VCBS repeat-containing protein [Acidobacteriota bacterium]
MTVADFNGDGKADLAVANLASDDVSILLGNGDGTFRTALPMPPGLAGTQPIAVASADLNGDGKIDLGVANLVSGVSVGLDNGDGTFQFSSYQGGSAGALAIGDLNGDGKLDIAVAAGSGNRAAQPKFPKPDHLRNGQRPNGDDNRRFQR